MTREDLDKLSKELQTKAAMKHQKAKEKLETELGAYFDGVEDAINAVRNLMDCPENTATVKPLRRDIPWEAD